MNWFKRVALYFFPRVHPGDSVSYIYANSFKYSFFASLVIGIVVYLLMQDDSYIQRILADITGTLGVVTQRDPTSVEHRSIGGIVFLIDCLFAYFFFRKYKTQIPERLYRKGWSRLYVAATMPIWIPVPALMLYLHQQVEASESIPWSCALLLSVSAIHGSWSAQFARILVALRQFF